MTTRVAALVLCTVVAASACGQDDEAQALDLARQACATYDQEEESLTTTDVIALAERQDEAADTAARAARLDPTWDELARSYDQAARFFSFVAGLPTYEGRPAQSQYTEEQEIDLAELVEDVGSSFRSVAAECRKAS